MAFKPFATGIALALSGLLLGCAHRPPLVLHTVGPTSGGRPRLLSGSEGLIQVYSATEARDIGKSMYYTHTPYLVYTADGKKVKAVQNHVGDMDQKPMSVSLPAGRYLVYAIASGYGRVPVPVLISSSRLTVVYLERDGMPEMEKKAIPDSEWVRLPDGRVIGRLAEEDQQKQP